MNFKLWRKKPVANKGYSSLRWNFLPKIPAGLLSFSTAEKSFGHFPQRNHSLNVVRHTKRPPHKQHIWFLPKRTPTLKKPKELFFANARNEIENEYIQ